MSIPQAILFGALLIAGSVMLLQNTGKAEAYASGPFQLMHHSNPTANAGVFRLDTSSGEVSYCYLSQNNNLVCSQAIK
ncbi:MAG: hypothetical protein WC612_00580 [Bdellovibrionales bacterium]|jgi:hypothetical protein